MQANYSQQKFHQPLKYHENIQQTAQKPQMKVESKSEEIEKNNRNEELIETESFKIIRTELKEIMRKDLLKKLIEQFSFKLIDDWEKQASIPVPGN